MEVTQTPTSFSSTSSFASDSFPSSSASSSTPELAELPFVPLVGAWVSGAEDCVLVKEEKVVEEAASSGENLRVARGVWW